MVKLSRTKFKSLFYENKRLHSGSLVVYEIHSKPLDGVDVAGRQCLLPQLPL